ncbi:hypothetical protein LVQ78_23350 [Buttiauxella sp. A2-C2_NF]|nr:hypothetical protein [Buttiauxella ferragutiae]
MTLAQLKKICARSGLNTQEPWAIVAHLNQQRPDFGIKELPEIKPPVTCGWLSRRITPISQEKAEENSWNHYRAQIQFWITQLETHEASLTKYQKVKRFVGKHKWMFGVFPAISGLVGFIKKLST